MRPASLLVAVALTRCTCSSEPEPIALTGVQPARAADDTATPITIVGSGFYPQIAIDYQSSQRSAIGLQFAARLGEHALELVTYSDSRHLTAVVPAGLPPGTYELTVVSPQDQIARLTDAFTVIASAVVDGGIGDAICRDRFGQDLAPTDAMSAEIRDTGPPDTVAADAGPDDRDGRDAIDRDAAQPDVAQPDVAQPDIAQPDTTACTRTPEWWNGAYGYRLPLSISESISGSLLAGYSVPATVDTATLINTGKLLASGDDLRVVRTVGASHQELDRHVVDLDGAATQIWFKTLADIDGSDATYMLYYGNPAAGAPPARWADSMGADAMPSAVYLAADDFEGHVVGTQPDGWEGAGDYSVQTDSGNQVLRVVGTGGGTADYFFAGDYAWTDVAVRGRIKVSTWGSSMYYGLLTRVESTSPFDTLWWGFLDTNTLELYTLAMSGVQAEALSGSSQRRTINFSPNAGSTWHTLETTLAGSSSTHFYDGVQRTTYTLPTSFLPSGRVGLCSGYSVALAYWDDIVVRRYVSPEPSVAAGAEEAACP
ncbi:MAG: hypothetical protein JXR83_06855 [Deltaproteobacteria bacterium]|nr:hypothetical protein [Deltaproteobacteria bacterium]